MSSFHEDRADWPFHGFRLYPGVPGGRLIATDRTEHGLTGCRAAVFEAPGGGLVFIDVDQASNGVHLDVVMAADLDELEAKLRARAAESNHPSAEYDACDAETIALAREALARAQ